MDRLLTVTRCLLLPLALTLAACGGSGSAGGNATPKPTATEDFPAHDAGVSILLGLNVAFAAPAYVGDTTANNDARAYLFFDLSVLPPAPSIQEVELHIPVTGTAGTPLTLSKIRLDHQGRASNVLGVADHMLALDDEDVTEFDPPVARGPGLVPTWTADVTKEILADLGAGHALAYFRLHTALGANGNAEQDGWFLGWLWSFDGLPHPATLRVTYLAQP